MQPFFNPAAIISTRKVHCETSRQQDGDALVAPSIELCLYSGSCNRAAAVILLLGKAPPLESGPTRFRCSAARRSPKAKQLANAPGNPSAQTGPANSVPAEDRLPPLEVDGLSFHRWLGHGLQVESWVRENTDLSASLVLIGDGICDAFVGMLYELGMEDNKKRLSSRQADMVAQAPDSCSALGCRSGWMSLSTKQRRHRFSLLEGGSSHSRLLRHLESLGYRIQTHPRHVGPGNGISGPWPHLVHHLRPAPCNHCPGQFLCD